MPQLCHEKLNFTEVFLFENSAGQREWIFENTLALFWEESQVEVVDIPEAQTLHLFGYFKLTPF